MHRRMQNTEDLLRDQPVSTAALDDLYERFLQRGELPMARNAAWGVLKRTLSARRGGKVSRQEFGCPPAGPPREQVFREAVFDSEAARNPARALIRILVEAGFDPSDPEFIPSDYEVPEFGSLAMHILGWPDAWVKPPYEAQLQRVMQQQTEIRSVGGRSEWWYREAATALAAFLNRGELSPEPDLRLYALTIAEMFAIHAHYFGRGDEALLAAFADAAATTGPQHEAALRTLGQLQARSGEAR